MTAVEALEGRTLLSAGALDPTFGTGGVVRDPAADGGAGEFFDVVVQPDGKLLAVGDSLTGPGTTVIRVARFNPDGSPDASFGDGGGTLLDIPGTDFDFADRVALQADGRFVITGTVLARFTADGHLDPTFGGGDGYVPAAGSGLAIQDDGRILIADGQRVTRYTRTGDLDPTFGAGGAVTFPGPIGEAHPRIPEYGSTYSGFSPIDVALQPGTGRILVGGATTGPTSELYDFAVARLTPDGLLDRSFAGGTGLASLDYNLSLDFGTRMDVAPNGQIAMAGENDDDQNFLVLFGPDGNSAKALEIKLGDYYGHSRDVAFTPDGKVVIVGAGEVYDRSVDNTFIETRLFRYAPAAGAFDLDVTTDVPGNFDDPWGIAVQADGDIVVAGSNGQAPYGRFLLRYDGGDLAPPAVDRVSVRGASWTTDFLAGLDSRGLGVAGEGFRVDDLAPGATLPWINADQVVLHYNRPVPAGASPDVGPDFFRGARSGYKVRRVDAPDAQTRVLTLDRPLGGLPSLSPDPAGDRVTVALPAANLVGAPIVLDVLPGDADRAGGRVNAIDLGVVKARLNRAAGDAPATGAQYTPFADVNADGRIAATDLGAVKARLNSALPPPPAPSKSALSSPIRRDVLNDSPGA